MKVINYKQLQALPKDTLFSTLSKMNELGELWVIGVYISGTKFIYSPAADAGQTGRQEVEFNDNTFNRQGSFILWTRAEVQNFVLKVQGVLDLGVDYELTQASAASQPATPDAEASVEEHERSEETEE
jgi:hypothetical protein